MRHRAYFFTKQAQRSVLLSFVFGAALLHACKKEPKTTEPENPYQTPVGVLNANSGYSQIWNKLSDNTGVIKEFVPLDITLEEGHLLHFATGINSTNPYLDYVRATVDINTGSVVANPANINMYPINGNVKYDKVVAQFFPYSNIFAIKTEVFSGNQNEGFYGDISAIGGYGAKPWGLNDFSFRYPVYNSGTSFGHFSTLQNNNPAIGSEYKMLYGGIGSNAIINYYKLSCIHEVYNDNGTNRYIAIGCTADSVQVYRIDYTSMGTASVYPEYTKTLLTAIRTDLPYTYSSVDENRALRHYSNDGKTLAFMVSEIATGEQNKTRSTYTYNFATNKLTQVLDKIKLDYAGYGSDIDIDENGYIYYTGTANFGANSNGVSVYKKTATGNELVGSDNFLKNGTIGKLRYLNGKVYMAVSGTKSGTDIKQVSLLKQD